MDEQTTTAVANASNTQTRPSITFESLTFSDGSVVHLQPDDIVVFVGPNNAGKSAALRELEVHFGPPVVQTVIKSATLRRDGTAVQLREFLDNWVVPFRAAFTDKVCTDEARIVQGEWMAAFGAQVGTHSGEFMGIAPTGKRVEIRYMDFWKVKDGKIVDNWVMVDFPHVMRQLGVDPFKGNGWESFDTGQVHEPQP